MDSFRASTLFWGNEAVERARNSAREFVSTYGDLEFAIYLNGALFERVA